jgi:hypothetical protein
LNKTVNTAMSKAMSPRQCAERACIHPTFIDDLCWWCWTSQEEGTRALERSLDFISPPERSSDTTYEAEDDASAT